MKMCERRRVNYSWPISTISTEMQNAFTGVFAFCEDLVWCPKATREVIMGHTESVRRPLTQSEVDVLNKDYKSFIERLKKRWLRYNNHPPEHWVLYELDEGVQKRVARTIRHWEEYMSPIAEKWWGRRGCGVIWPEKSSDPCKIYRLEAA